MGPSAVQRAWPTVADGEPEGEADGETEDAADGEGEADAEFDGEADGEAGPARTPTRPDR